MSGDKKIIITDGNTAAADMAYEFSEVAAIYPITPSSPMAGATDAWSAKGRKNSFGQRVKLVEMQSEAGAIGAVHGALQAGALAVTFTSSQGLLLMIPTLYRIAGERLPAVLHVAARTVGTHAMSIFGDHSDVMACRQTGVAMLCSGSVQEAAEISAVAHLAALKGKTPFIHFFDGFRTSHELCSIEAPDKEKIAALLDKDALSAYRKYALNPEHPRLRNTVMNDDVYFQIREAANHFYTDLPDIVEDYLCKINEICGRDYHLFNYYGAEDATDVIVAMGSVSGTIKDVVDWENKNGKKCGFLEIHLYRPFDIKRFLSALPESVERIAVLDRTKEPGALGEPLYQDVCAAFMETGKNIRVIGGRYGLSSKDTDPKQIAAVFENLAADEPVKSFTIGIEDDVTNLSLPLKELEGFFSSKIMSCKFWGLGGDGTVGANHNTVQILGDCAGLYSQAYFQYDAKKSFGVTKSHLRFSPEPIRGSYYVKMADFVACHSQSYMNGFDVVDEIKPEGTFLLNCEWGEKELEENIPSKAKKIIAERKIKFYTINATHIAEKLGLGSHTNTVLQAAFFALCGLIPAETALEKMKQAARDTYVSKGEEVIQKNIAAIEEGANALKKIEVPEAWLGASEEEPGYDESLPSVVKDILYPINYQKGDKLPVSTFIGREDGTIEYGLTAYEKRGIAVNVPSWDAASCIQCNLCSFVCPHAAIRPYLLDEEEALAAPSILKTVPAKGADEYKFSIIVSEFDCTGCGSCVSVCPKSGEALKMKPAELKEENKELWAFGLSLKNKGDVFDPYTVKGSQFRQPLVEFSAACAGCGETPYAKLLTQLFGDRMYWANGTGCSQAWGAPMPGIPYTTNEKGRGPAWTNSLFENNAELMLGIYLSVSQQRDAEKQRIEKLAEISFGGLKNLCENWLKEFDSFDGSRKASDELIAALEKIIKGGASCENIELIKEIYECRDYMARKTFWMYGGDGGAYDIGYGGLDHVIASGHNINCFIIDTEVYSNTGGQSSKATPLGAVAQFASAGKGTGKKDLGAIMMSYGNVYVAQVAMGAGPAQLVKVLKEAEEYDGPSVVVAYTPCTAHGIRSGMCNVQNEMKRAVNSGYWMLYHYDPRLEHPMKLDSQAPKMPYQEFLDGENRYLSLKGTFPERAEKLFAEAAEAAGARYAKYKKMEE